MFTKSVAWVPMMKKTSSMAIRYILKCRTVGEVCLLAWEDMEETALMMALAVAVAVVWEEASG